MAEKKEEKEERGSVETPESASEAGNARTTQVDPAHASYSSPQEEGTTSSSGETGGGKGRQGKSSTHRGTAGEKAARATAGGGKEGGAGGKRVGSAASGGETTAAEGEAASRPGETGKEEVSEDEFRRLVEESLERVTVAEVVLTVMSQLSSLGYLKMGLPESVNLKYRDLSQALLAIDILEAMLKGAEGKIPEDSLKPFRGTLANLQLNYVQLKKRRG